MENQKVIRVLITNSNHPHHNKVGVLSGKTIHTIWQEEMAEVILDTGGGCYISKGDAKQLAPFQSGETRPYGIGLNSLK